MTGGDGGGRAAAPVSVAVHPSKGLMVVAAARIPAGQVAVVGRAVGTVSQRTQHSFQKDWDRHVELDEPARLMNHSCGPNTGVVDNDEDGYDFIALRDIEMGEELTWDYETTEYESIAVDRCLCGSESCRGRTAGYGPANSLSRTHYVAAYLKSGRRPQPDP